MELNQSVKELLGQSGIEQLQKFQSFGHGWANGAGDPLSQQSLAMLIQFANKLPCTPLFRPKLLMTFCGNLQLVWKDLSKKYIYIDFYPDKIGYFIEAIEEEDAVFLDNIHYLFEKIGFQ